ncbi:MAG: amidase, partial [bacterium]|nr:amidase [bacterium]
MTDIAQLFNCSIVEVQKRRTKGEFSYEELTRSSLDLLKTWEGEIHAFITVTEDEAMKQAKHADKLFSNDGVIHPLLGIPFTVKDTFCTKGIQTTAGSNILKGYIPPYTATAVQRVLDAGAVLLGKTNCDSFGHGSSTENSDFGPTRNPWRGKSGMFEYVPGGSSGGSAASLSVGIGWFSIGEDTGGSIRQPAAFCGVCGLKPTYGRVSRYGSIAYASSLDTVGPMARSTIDLRTVFDTIVEPDENDATLVSRHNREKRTVRSIGLPTEFFADLSSEQSTVIEHAVFMFKKAG